MEELLAALEREARESAEATVEAARVEVARIRERAAAEAARLRAEHLGRVEAEEHARSARALVEARRRARGAVLTARAALLERVFERARLGLPAALSSAPTRRRLARDAREALRFLPPGGAVLECPPTLADETRAAVADRPGVRVEPREGAAPGIVLRGTDPAAPAVDDTLPARLERWRPELAIAVVRRLGTEEP